MSEFEKIIGYETIKEELLQICDMIKNKEVYSALGAKLPQGILLSGEPGLGKTLMAKCFIKESGLKSFTVRRNRGDDDFIELITQTFKLAKESAPSVIFLDDMDKFANEDDDHRNAEEYVAVQSGIDEIKGSDVFVIATVNEFYKLPESLTRPGRFDRTVEVSAPTAEDAKKIIEHYLSDKKVSDSVNIEDLTKMISYSSCAELETILNEAAINAAYKRKEFIDNDDLIKSVLRMQYDAPDNFTETSDEDMEMRALHEAGHLVASDVLVPGSVGLASVRARGRDLTGGFTHRCKELPRRDYDIIISLAGKAAVELYCSEACADGCQSDIARACSNIRGAMSENGACGLGMIDVSTGYSPDMSENLNFVSESIVHAELERYMFKARDILIKNRDFLEKAAEALIAKETLLNSDIKAIRDSCKNGDYTCQKFWKEV